MNTSIAILILAAGASRRMGEPKQLLPWKGTTLLGHAIHTAHASIANETIVVLGAAAEDVKSGISRVNVQILENKDWESGMGSSIRCGVDYLVKQNKELDGILIMLCDQPLINTAYLNKMIREYRESRYKLVGTKYEQGIGVPAIFGSDYFSELCRLDEDMGAKKILKKHEQQVESINAPVKLMDIDTREDYEYLLNIRNQL